MITQHHLLILPETLNSTTAAAPAPSPPPPPPLQQLYWYIVIYYLNLYRNKSQVLLNLAIKLTDVILLADAACEAMK